MNEPQPQYGQQQYPQQPQYAAHPAPPHQPFKIPKMIGYILLMVAVIMIPLGAMVTINADIDDMDDYTDAIKLGANLKQLGLLLTAVFSMMLLGMCPELDKFEKLGILLFLGVVVLAIGAGGFDLGDLF